MNKQQYKVVYILNDPYTLQYYNSRRKLAKLLFTYKSNEKKRELVRKLIDLDIWASDNIFKGKKQGRIIKKRLPLLSNIKKKKLK